MVNLTSWGHWSLTFYVGETTYSRDAISFFGELPFPVGAQGPMDGCLGSSLRQRFANACKEWSEGNCPTGTICYLDKKWLYQNEKVTN